MSKPSRDELMARSQEALTHAIKVCERWQTATIEELTHAHQWLNKTGDPLLEERGIDRRLAMIKNYKATLLIRITTKKRQAERVQARP
jgi:hypothetical protein